LNLAKKRHLLLGIIVLFLLTGCAGQTDQVFLPEVFSGEGEAQEVFVPAV
jgi:hypothetical protein